MRPKNFRILSAITAGSLALAVAVVTASSGTSQTARHAALAAQTESLPPVNLDNCPTLYMGYPRGGCVAQLQTELDTILGLNLPVDGTFGLATKSAVERFQQEHNIVPADGIVGPQTKVALDNPGSSSAATPPGQLNPGQQITSGTQITSPNGKFVLQMQSDGNLVIRAPGNIPIGDTHTAGHDGTIAVMQTDGNFVLRAPGNIPVWASGTDGHPGTVLQVQDDGGVVLYAPDYQALRVIFPAFRDLQKSAPTPTVPPAAVPPPTPSQAPSTPSSPASTSTNQQKAYGHWDCTIVGTDGNDVIRGTPGNDTICAGPGNDVVYGGGGSDTIYGDAGNDVIYGSNGTVASTSGGGLAGGDELVGGPGNDTIYGRGGPDDIEGGSGNDVLWAGPGDDLVYGDNIPGGVTATGNDRIYGQAGNDDLQGGPGNDQIYAGSNTTLDVAYGGPGNDLLAGSAPSFDDTFYGEGGNDILIPDPLRLDPLGNDVSGGDGNDVIVTFNGAMDGYSTGSDVSVPVSDACSVKVPAVQDSAGNLNWSVECKLPFGGGLKDFSLNEDSQGNITGGAALADGLFSLHVNSWQKLLNSEANTLEADEVLVDPPMPPFSIGDLDV